MTTKDFLGNEWDITCMGCAISNHSMLAPGGLVQKTQHFCVHQDPLIPLPGFLVIASLRHIQFIVDMRESEYEEFSRLLWITHAAIKKVTGVQYLTMVQEEYSKHFHLWFFPWTPSVVEKYGSPALTKIREIMADYKNQSIDKAAWKALEESIEKIKQYMQEA
jgi:diadenosine tetraphosphate (Ap4A) HIT family hydrolase